MQINENLSLQQAVGDRLGIKLSEHAPLRNAVNTLLSAMAKAGLVKPIESKIPFSASDRKRLSIPPKDVTTLLNAVLLQGVFAEPKVVIRLFTCMEDRLQHAVWARELLFDRQSVGALGLIRPSLLQFLDMLATATVDLRTESLPSPFVDNVLPQMGLGPAAGSSLLKTLAAQTACLSPGDGMMAMYLEGNLEKAHEAALALETPNPVLNSYRNKILTEYRDAKEFNDLLDEWL